MHSLSFINFISFTFFSIIFFFYIPPLSLIQCFIHIFSLSSPVPFFSLPSLVFSPSQYVPFFYLLYSLSFNLDPFFSLFVIFFSCHLYNFLHPPSLQFSLLHFFTLLPFLCLFTFPISLFSSFLSPFSLNLCSFPPLMLFICTV